MSYNQFLNEDLDSLWKKGVDRVDNDTAGKIKVFIDKLEQTKEIKNVIEGFKDITADIITETEKSILESIPTEEKEDSEKIKMIGQKVFSVLSSIEIFLTKISERFEDVYSPINIFKDSKTPAKEIFSYNTIDEFEKNINNNVIKLLQVWGKDAQLSSEGLSKINDFRLLEANEEENVPVTIIGEKAINLLKYIREFVLKKIITVSK